MKILVVVPWAPSPIRPRSLGLIRHLAENHTVSVVGATWSDEDVQDLRSLPVDRVTAVKLTKVGAILRCFLALFTRRSLQQSYVDANSMRNAIRLETAKFQPDIVYFNVIRTAQFIDEVDGLPSVIDLDEFRSTYYDLLSAKSRNFAWKFIGRAEAARMRHAEQKVLKDFDRVLVSSPTDVAKEPHKTRLVRSPHALADNVETHVVRRTPGSLIFVGRQSYRANSEAILWFVENVYPRVLEKVPYAHLSIVGDSPPADILKLSGPHISVTGRVDDLSGYYTTACASIIPVKMATGVQMKLIESMTLGAPVVATPIVAHGAGIDEGLCHIAETIDEWVDSVTDLLLGSESRDRLSANASAWVESTYSLEAITSSLDQVLAEIAIDRDQESLR